MKYNIPASNMQKLKESIKSLNGRAKKNKLPPVELIVGEPYIQEAEFNGFTIQRKFFPCEVLGKTVVVAGWECVGKIEQYQNDFIIKSFQDIPEELRNHFVCDHCQEKRRRKTVFVLKNSNNDYKVVGKSCLRDFLGVDPQAILDFYSLFESVQKTANHDAEYHFDSTYDLHFFLMLTCASCRQYGYVSKHNSNGKRPTADSIFYDYAVGRNLDEISIELQDNDLAVKIIEYFQTFYPKNNFEHNLKLVATKEVVDSKTYGYAASMYQTYQNVLHKLEQETQKVKLVSSPLGEVGQRIEVDVVVEKFISFIDTEYPCTLIVFRNEDKNIVKWYCYGKHSFEEGEACRISGTIKKIMEDKFCEGLVTLLNRVKKK